MTQDVRQWLAEIKSLQQKLVEAHQERDEAYASASKWRSLYETEAKQRRTDAALARQTIDRLKLELDGQSPVSGMPQAVDCRLQGLTTTPTPAAPDSFAIQQEVAQLQSIQALQERLTQALIEGEQSAQKVTRLGQALQTEQAEHIKTRKNLTTALGDTVDRLTKERSNRQDQPVPPPEKPKNESASVAKNPSLELPTLD